MNSKTFFSRIVSALSALAILNQILTPDQFDLLNSIRSALKAGSVVNVVRRKPRRSALACLALACLLLGGGASRCGGSQTLRGTAAGIGEGAKQFKTEVELLYDRGEITADEHDVLTASAEELQSISAGFVSRAADWPRLSKAARLDLAGDAVEEIGAAVERLSAKNVGIKSEKAKAELAERLRLARLAVSTLRVIEASLPPAPTPSPTP